VAAAGSPSERLIPGPFGPGSPQLVVPQPLERPKATCRRKDVPPAPCHAAVCSARPIERSSVAVPRCTLRSKRTLRGGNVSPDRIQPLRRPLLPGGGQHADGQDLLLGRQAHEDERKHVGKGVCCEGVCCVGVCGKGVSARCRSRSAAARVSTGIVCSCG